MGYDKDRTERFKREIQEALDGFDFQSPPPDDNGMGKFAFQPSPADPSEASITSAPANGESWPGLCKSYVNKFFLGSNALAFERLIRRQFVPCELLPLIEKLLASKDMGHAIRHLAEDDAQTFIDVMDEARYEPGLP